MNDEELAGANVAEVEFFPLAPDDELEALKEIIGEREVDVRAIGDAGYFITRKGPHVIAEAPWALVDFDDTAAKTTSDKKDRCWPAVEGIGVSPDLVQFCDKISRVNFGEAGVIYEPELEMRLLTRAIEMAKSGSDEGAIKLALADMRKEIVLNGAFNEHAVAEDVQGIYDETRYTSTLYPDVAETLTRLRGGEERPINVALLTYGDPQFQLRKTLSLIDDNEALGSIFLTKVKKGDFFKSLLEDNPFADMPLQYTYPETERGVGINFRDWRVMVTLFDDDPSQVASFNTFAEEQGIPGLGVVRVRREGAKRSDRDLDIPRGSAEMRPSDTYLDAEIFEQALTRLEAIQMENFIVEALKEHHPQVLLAEPDVKDLIQAIANRKGLSFEEARSRILELAGVPERTLEDFS
ncbi:hypothetical protein KBD09_02355 [Candidatus Woesebacteria bacterium]|nr:hypothetical protein [Candidatus Woesebacteria bacterium]